MFAILFNRVAEYKDSFVTENIISDISHLVQTRSGKIEAGPSFHDDSIMSYLIAMYVFYHGNNLPAFGVIKGKEYQSEKNTGIKQYTEEELMKVLPAEIVEAAKRQEAVRKENDYEALMRSALVESQRETLALHRSGLVNNDVLENTADYLLDDIYESDGDIPLDFFDSLNGY